MNVDNWTDVEKAFDEIDDMQIRVRFLRELIVNTDICSSNSCEIFPDLHHFKQHTKTLREFGIYTLRDAKNKIKNEIELRNFKALYEQLEKESEEVFSKIYAMFSVRKTKEGQLKVWHERQIEIMKVQNQSRLPISQEFVDESQGYIDMVQTNAQDSELFKKAQEKMKKEAK